MSAIQNVALTAGPVGNRALISKEIIAKICEHLSVGNYIRPSVEACGIAYPTFRTWVVRGDEEKARGITSLYTEMVDALAHAQAAAEASIVHELRKAEDWRAQSFLLERRHRDRWGKEEQQSKAAITISLPADAAAVLLDAMRVGSAHIIEGEVVADPQSAGQSANTSNLLDNSAPPEPAAQQRPEKTSNSDDSSES